MNKNAMAVAVNDRLKNTHNQIKKCDDGIEQVFQQNAMIHYNKFAKIKGNRCNRKLVLPTFTITKTSAATHKIMLHTSHVQ